MRINSYSLVTAIKFQKIVVDLQKTLSS